MNNTVTASRHGQVKYPLGIGKKVTEMTNRDILKLHNIKNDVDRMYEEGTITL